MSNMGIYIIYITHYLNMSNLHIMYKFVNLYIQNSQVNILYIRMQTNKIHHCTNYKQLNQNNLYIFDHTIYINYFHNITLLDNIAHYCMMYMFHSLICNFIYKPNSYSNYIKCNCFVCIFNIYYLLNSILVDNPNNLIQLCINCMEINILYMQFMMI